MKGKTKYLMSMGTLSRKDQSLCFRVGEKNHYLPITGVREIYCLNEISINTKLLDFLSKHQIVVHFFGYYGQYSGTYYPRESLLSGRVTMEQVDLFHRRRLDIAKSIVKATAENLGEVVYHYLRHGDDEVMKFLDFVKVDFPEKLEKIRDHPQLLWLEGFLWERFYRVLNVVITDAFEIKKRVRRPPDNPLNAMISFGNSMLYAKTITQIYHTHLNQTVSFLHAPSEGRFSLSLDLCEPFKPHVVYRTILYLANKRMIKPDVHFVKGTNGCLLNDKGRTLFLKAFEDRLNETFQHSRLKRAVSYETAIKYDGYKLVKAALEDQPFVPFSIKDLC